RIPVVFGIRGNSSGFQLANGLKMKLKFRYFVSGDWRNPYTTFERALRRARELRSKIGQSFDVLEVDQFGNETPIAMVAPKRRAKLITEPNTNYDRSVI